MLSIKAQKSLSWFMIVCASFDMFAFIVGSFMLHHHNFSRVVFHWLHMPIYDWVLPIERILWFSVGVAIYPRKSMGMVTEVRPIVDETTWPPAPKGPNMG